MLEAAAVKLDKTLDKARFEKLMTYVSYEKRERIRRFRKYEDALRSLIGDVLARYLICRRLKIVNKDIVFGANEYGKPFLKNCRDVEFNISHSGKWVACSLGNLPTGIDIEQIRPIDMGIAQRFFSKEEFKNLMSKNISEREAFFYDLWTLKESYIKAVGKGLSIPLNSFTISIQEDNITIHTMHGKDNYYARQYYIDKDYKMAICSIKNEFPQNVDLIDVNDLYDRITLL